MKQTDNSNATVPTDTTFSKGKERISTLKIRIAHFRRQGKILLALIGLGLAITVYFLAQRSLSNHSTVNVPVPISDGKPLEVEVSDGTGTAGMKIAQNMTNILRSLGYDVVEMKKNNNGVIDRTFILDRSGNLEAARQLAKKIGVASDKVFQKIDRNLYLDVTVMVGKDYSQLKVFQSSSERNIR